MDEMNARNNRASELRVGSLRGQRQHDDKEGKLRQSTEVARCRLPTPIALPSGSGSNRTPKIYQGKLQKKQT